MKDVYLNRIEKFLPNEPVSNDEMENYLGLINGNVSKSRGMILRSNQIKNRFYALDKDGNPTHTNAELAATAIRKLFDENFRLEDVNLLTTGTSSADELQPSHALMVLGELGGKPIEAMSAHGTCNAAMTSLKYARMAIQTGDAENAVCAGSETLGSWMLAQNFDPEIDKRKEIEKNPFIGFEKDFIRWMLSDGAAAVLLQDKPNPDGLSLKFDWIEIVSFANELETCMYAGAEKNPDGSVTGWKDMTPDERIKKSVFSLKQDAKLLQNHIVSAGAGYMKQMMDKHGIKAAEIDYFLPHISSMFFKEKVYQGLAEVGVVIPYEKWFINLTRVGNVGAASAFLMLEELFHSKKLKKGEKIFLMVPESARFSYAFVSLTVV
jgi:3-oxoacyl-[acyl-carrier-protein] synthase-3